MGGCFDSAAGAAGQIQRAMEQEYGVQDFFGVIEEMRIWRVARSAEQIRQGQRGGRVALVLKQPPMQS